MLNNRKLKVYHMIFAVATILLGILFHFLYEWSGQNVFLSIFVPISESSWEHLKLLFYPFVLLAILEYYLIGYLYPNYLISSAVSVLLGMIFILIFFYTYTGILGQSYLVLDILSFILSVVFTYYISYNLLIEEFALHQNGQTIIGLLIFIIIFIAFSIFTFVQPNLPLFLSVTAYVPYHYTIF